MCNLLSLIERGCSGRNFSDGLSKSLHGRYKGKATLFFSSFFSFGGG